MSALLASALLTSLLSPAGAVTSPPANAVTSPSTDAVTGAAGECSGVASDFDADGRPDTVVAAPYATVGGVFRAGEVTVRYGTGRTERLSQGSRGAPGAAETGDSFGSAVAAGDFDGDGCADLAVGASEEFLDARRPGEDGDGVVHLFHGSPRGLRPGKALDVTGFGRRAAGDRFGAALAVGQLDGDRADELVIGVPGLGVGGGIGVYGVKGHRPYTLTKETPWIAQDALSTDEFGATVAAGDFDGDGRDEVAVGAPGDGGQRSGAGSVTILDLAARQAGAYTQESPNVKGSAEKWDHFGAALAVGDFDADGRDDLAIGVPGEDLDANVRALDYGAGAVHVLYGSRRGLSALGSEMWTQNTRGVVGRARYADRFGTALAAGDFNGDGDDDLAIGVPGESAVQVLAGTRSGGLTRHHNVLIPRGRDGFGASLAPVRRADGSPDDLLVGSPDHGTVVLIGGAVRKGSYPGLSARRLRPHGSGPAGSLYGYALLP
ncbi:FG-GAP and VCBS repeat-containing protein [Streptosporangium jomthongense]|uniref:FG-GAP and VCBS repeat-containing protein n=1 Tax=Streptosporangium jomthongense TaxID=1193683 RepID=A0ABV8F760_9ACTN